MQDYNFDPELRDFASLVPHSSMEDIHESRALITSMTAAMNSQIDTSGITIEDRQIDGEQSGLKIPLRCYTPTTTANKSSNNGNVAGLLMIHGGGFVSGSLDTEHGGAVRYCRELGAVVISVDYRLAPEHPYPAGLEDCYSALCWMHEHSAELGIDPERIAIAGQSAGGGLSAALALLNKARGGPKICFQLLGMPELDDRLETTSMIEFVDTPLWHRPNAILSWDYYLGDLKRGSAEIPITAAPARASVDDLRGLPPALVTTMEFDPLRDEGIDYAQQLLRAGVSVELHNYPGTFHGSSLARDADVSKREQRDLLAALQRALGPEQ